MKLEYKDGKIYITADSAEQLTKAHKVSEGITKEGDRREDYEIRMIPVIFSTKDSEVTEVERTFIEVYR